MGLAESWRSRVIASGRSAGRPTTLADAGLSVLVCGAARRRVFRVRSPLAEAVDALVR